MMGCFDEVFRKCSECKEKFALAVSSFHMHYTPPLSCDRLTGLVVKASFSRAEDPGFKSLLQQDFSMLSHTCDLKIGTPVATLTGAWRYKVSAGTGRPDSSIL